MEPELLTDWHLFALAANPWCRVADAAAAAIAGDPVARCAAADYLEEEGEIMSPFEVGECYLIQTVTLYYVGRVARVQGGFVELESASWVHWTGRLSTLCKRLKFTGFAQSERRPRTEFVGPAGISLAAIVAYIPGKWNLPQESVQ